MVEGGWRHGLGGEEVAEFLALLLVVRRIPGDICGLALEEVGHDDAVGLVRVGGGEDVGSLEGLVEEAEDVCSRQSAAIQLVSEYLSHTVDDENGLLGVFGPGDV
jgi:hypothetical protein